jgi:hypothetical protein
MESALAGRARVVALVQTATQVAVAMVWAQLSPVVNARDKP